MGDAQGQEAPELGGIRAGPPLAAGLYVLLAASAALALFAHQAPWALPAALTAAAPWVFLAFVACFSVYRLVLVRAKKYPASKAFFQIGLALFFFTVLLVSRGKPSDAGQGSLEALLASGDPRVRALAAEVARYRPDGNRYAPRLVRALADPDPAVRTEAHASLVRLTGQDLGDPDEPAGLEAWRRRYP